MFDFLIENKEWLFSGAGVVVVTSVISLFLKRERPSRDNEKQPRVRQSEEKEKYDEFEEEVTEVQKLAGRFCTVLELMNEGRNYSKFTIPQLAQIMKLHKISELENVFTGKVEPSFSFIEEFSNTFGVNKNWLTEGKDAPYSNDLERCNDPTDYLPLIDQLKPEAIYFVRENSDTAPAFIVLKVAKWRYITLSRTWHISDQVGAGGQRQLFSFYTLIKALRDERKLHTKCWGLTLEKGDFDKLLCGEAFPGKYFDIGFSEDPWWDDLTDIEHKYPISESYGNWHGKSFIKAQSIIRWYLKERNAS